MADAAVRYPSLRFGRTHVPTGFTSGLVAHYDDSAIPVVRELTQNSLDAADGVADKCEVVFEIFEAPTESIPCLDDYKAALESARQHRKRWQHGGRSHDETDTLRQIDECLANETVTVLTCTDNGCGFDARRLDAVLTTGNTLKGGDLLSMGSFGLGHLAALAASGLRYVTYAGRTLSGETMMSGHALLASHTDTDGDLRAADGFLAAEFPAFDGSSDSYLFEATTLMKSLMEPMTASGAVVAVLGFRDFRRDATDPDELTPTQQIAAAAASNFVAAISTERLRVQISDHRSGEHIDLDSDTINETLETHSNERRSEISGGISGEAAHSIWRTLHTGQLTKMPDRCGSLYWRRSDESIQARTRVHVLRKGMWITSTAPGLSGTVFGDTYPVEAVLTLEDEPLAELVRAAEGPAHHSIDLRRLDPSDRRELKQHINEIVDRLKLIAGERPRNNEYQPAGFAVIVGGSVSVADQRPRRDGSSLQGSDHKAVLEALSAEGLLSDDDAPQAESEELEMQHPASQSLNEPQRPQPTTPHPPARRPRKGKPAAHRYAPSSVTATRMKLFLDEEEDTEPATVGVRLRLPSGSDATCSAPWPDEWMMLRSVALTRSDETREVVSRWHDGEPELLLENVDGSWDLEVDPAGDTPVPTVATLDLVSRQSA